MSRPKADFLRIITDAGIPTSEAALLAELNGEIEASGSLVNNNSRISPFWKLQQALVIKPALWFVRTLLANHVIPNSFVATANGYYLDLKAWDVSLDRKESTQASGSVSFVKIASSDDVTVPAKTIVSTERINDKTYRLITQHDTRIPPGVKIAPVLCRAEHSGTAYNLPAGYFNILTNDVPGIESVVNPDDWLISAGADREDDEQLALRIQNQFNVVGRYHIDSAYRAMLASVAGIRSDHVFFEHDAPRGPGTANAYILMESGPTSQTLLDRLNRYINEEGNHGHGDDLQCFALPAAPQDVVVNVWLNALLTAEQKEKEVALIKQMIRAAFREVADFPGITRVFPFSRFSFSRLSQQLHDALPELEHIEFNLVSIVSEKSLPKLNSLTVTPNA